MVSALTRSMALLIATEVGPSMQPEGINLRSYIAMEVDNDIPEWLTEEQGYCKISYILLLKDIYAMHIYLYFRYYINFYIFY